MKWPNKSFNKKPCRWCREEFQPTAPCNHYCGPECSKQGLRNKYYLRMYGIDLNTYRTMLESQGSKCAICGGDGFKLQDFHNGTFVVDHDHDTGEIRGLLCHQCNQGIGLFKERLDLIEKAVEYLKKGSETIRKEYNSSELEAHSSSKEDDDIVRSYEKS